MVGERITYASYLLRLWKAEEENKPCWRASLECAQTGERRNFASLELMLAFLLEQFKSRPSMLTVEPERGES